MKDALTRNLRRIGKVALLMLPALFDLNTGARFGAIGATFTEPVSSEWSTLFSHLSHLHPWLYAFYALAIGWLIALVVDARQRYSALSLLVAGLLVLSVVYARFVAEFSIVAVVVIHRGLCERWTALAKPNTLRPLLLQTLGLVAVLLFLTFEIIRTYGRVGFGMDLKSNPVTQTKFMKRHGMHGRVFATTRGANSYISLQMWPDVLIFRDGRVPQVFPLWFSKLAARACDPEVFDKLVTRYDFDHVVITEGTLETTGDRTLETTSYRWGQLLQRNGGFMLVYFDEHGMVWTRRRDRGLGCQGCMPIELIPVWRIDVRWIKNELPKLPFEPILQELTYALRVTSGSPFIRSMIYTFGYYAPLDETRRASLRDLAHASVSRRVHK